MSSSRLHPLPGWMGAPSPFAFDATRLALAEGARRFTQSTMSYVSVVGLTTAMDQLLAIGLDSVERHARRLHDLLLDAVEDRGWHPFRNRADPAAASHIVSLDVEVRSAASMSRLPARRSCAVPAETGSGCPWLPTTTKMTSALLQRRSRSPLCDTHEASR